MEYRLSPSNLTYLYEDCKHCFVLQVKHNVLRPSIGLPWIFTKIANVQKEYYSGRRTEEFCKELPPGVVNYGENWVQSEVINPIGCASGCQHMDSQNKARAIAARHRPGGADRGGRPQRQPGVLGPDGARTGHE